jgi:hypothetical protein
VCSRVVTCIACLLVRVLLVWCTPQLNYAFILLFAMEACLKVAALSFRQYLRDPWNVLDFAIVVASVLDAILVFSSVSVTVRRRCMSPARARARARACM